MTDLNPLGRSAGGPAAAAIPPTIRPRGSKKYFFYFLCGLRPFHVVYTVFPLGVLYLEHSQLSQLAF